MDPYVVEQVMGHPLTQRVFRYITKKRRDGRSLLEDAMISYGGDGEGIPLEEKLGSFPLKLALGALRKWGFKASKQSVKEQVFGDVHARRAIVNVIRSVGELGLTRPQAFLSPLLVVWNFTDACNLRCRHCYQEAGRPSEDEMSVEEKKEVVDQLAEAYVPFLAFSGGEPLMGKGFWEVAEYARDRGIWLSVATNGTLVTPEVAERLYDVGIDYIQISLDSPVPERHDWFRGIPGAWKKTVEGIKNAVAAKKRPTSSVGVAMVLMRWNYGEVDDMVKLVADLGVDIFYIYNFIPVGNARAMAEQDISPEMREDVLHKLYRYLAEGRISVMTTSPQFGRVCMMEAPAGGRMVMGHYGIDAGERARVLAQYIGGCGAGRAYCCIEPDGTVTPCVFMKLPVGDLRKQRFLDIWRNSPVMSKLRDRENLKENCRSCEYRPVCGGCRARAYNYFGDYLGPDPGCINNISRWQALKAA